MLSIFEDLPLDVLLVIRDTLEIPSQVLLGLTCKRLYSVFDRKLDPTRYSEEEKVEIGKLLEIDWPEYLTCRKCGTFFKWQHRAHRGYKCPHPENHFRDADRYPSIPVMLTDNRCLPLNSTLFETVNLIHRYYERGPKTGIAACILNRSHKGWGDGLHETRARWIDGQLVVHAQWTLELKSWPVTDLNTLKWKTFRVCDHLDMSPYEWAQQRITTACPANAQHTKMLKCSHCPCDAGFSWQTFANGSVKVTLRAWQNYGNSQTDYLPLFQFLGWPMFDRHIETDIGAQRDLRCLFDNGQDDQEDDEIRRVRKELEDHESIPYELTF